MIPWCVSPVELAAAVYSSEPCARTFKEDLEASLLHGHVHCTPELFVMGRAVVSTAPRDEIVNPWHVFQADKCDAWMIYLAAGNLAKALAFVPFALPLICFERSNSLRFYPFAAFRRRLSAGGQFTVKPQMARTA